MKQKTRQENAGTMTVFTASSASPRDSSCQGLARHLQPEMESVSSWQDLQYITTREGSCQELTELLTHSVGWCQGLTRLVTHHHPPRGWKVCQQSYLPPDSSTVAKDGVSQ